MDILIKNMEMPKNCHDCKNGWCNLWEQNKNMTTGKHPDCPLVAFPDNHGRLIDADKCGKILLDKFIEGLGKWDEFYSAGYRYALKYFSQAPTIVEASNGTDN